MLFTTTGCSVFLLFKLYQEPININLDLAYDAKTSDLVHGCVHPDRHRRYSCTSSETVLKQRKVTRHRRFVDVRPGDFKVQSDAQNRIHVRLGHCWIMTGILHGGRMMWRNAARGMTTCVQRRRQAMRVMQSALKMFISKIQRSDGSLKALHCTEWPFDHSIQGQEWLKLLEVYGLAEWSRYRAKSCTCANLAPCVDGQKCTSRIKTQTTKTVVSEKPKAIMVVEWDGDGTVIGHAEGDESVYIA